MYEKYFNRLREECLIRNRSSRTADTYINNIRHFMKWTGYKSMEDFFSSPSERAMTAMSVTALSLKGSQLIYSAFSFFFLL